jgi:hypothetical protein
MSLNGCPVVVSRSLGCGAECVTYVADAKQLNDIAMQWRDAGCRTPVCTAVACQNATSGLCMIGRALTGMCTDNYLGSI